MAMCIIESNAFSDLKQAKHPWCLRDHVRKLSDRSESDALEQVLVSECAVANGLATDTAKSCTDNAVRGVGRRHCWSVLRRRAMQTLSQRRGRACVQLQHLEGAWRGDVCSRSLLVAASRRSFHCELVQGVGNVVKYTENLENFESKAKEAVADCHRLARLAQCLSSSLELLSILQL